MHIFKRAPAKATLRPILSSLLLLLFLFIPFKSHANEASFSTGQLSNGLTYYIHYDPYSKHHTSLDFVVKTGSLDEQEDESGFSHLIEHAVLDKLQFKGKKLTDLHCEIWDYTYPNIGGVTSYHFTHYHLEISLAITRGLEEGLLGFSNALSQFSLDEHDLQEMKEELLEELDENQVSPITTWKEWRIGQEYPPYRNKDPFGNQKAISKASLEKIHQFYRKKYHPHRIAVVIIGNVDLNKTKELIEKYFGHFPAAHETSTFRSNLEPALQESSVYINQRLKNTFISLTKPLPRMSQRDSLVFSILTRMLSQQLKAYAESLQAKFSQPILEFLTYPQMLRLTVSLTDDFEEGIHQLRDGLHSFFSQIITESQLDSIKAEMKNHLKTIQEKGNGPSLIAFYRDHFILNAPSLETDHPDLRIALLDTINAEDITHALQTFQGFSQVFLASPDEEVNHISPDLFSKLILRNTDYLRSAYDN